MYDKVYIGLGSNIGNRLQNIKKAINIISADNKIIINKVSSIYISDPEEDDSLPEFYNAVIEVSTEYEPIELLEALKSIEKSMGRNLKREKRYEPRIIDLDIIAFNSIVIKGDILCIPHDKMKQRKFVLIPLEEIAPDFVCPDCGLTISNMIYNLRDKDKKVEKAVKILL